MPPRLYKRPRALPAHPDLEVRSYEAAYPLFAQHESVPYPTFETVVPQWDNTARTGPRAVVLHGSTPESYEKWLHEVLVRTLERPKEQRVVFVNAWNEWGEGCHLEPDRRWGHAYLEATRRALERASAAPRTTHPDVAGDLLASLLLEDAR